jgi:DNA-binding transcriptional MerR regulator
VARRSGVAASALRYYEQRGLIQSERAGSGHRRFPRAVLRRIAFIVFAHGRHSRTNRSSSQVDALQGQEEGNGQGRKSRAMAKVHKTRSFFGN